MQDIKYLFEPRSVAVIGATSNPGKLGYVVVYNIVTSGYKGRVYPVNPKGGEILGLKAVKSLAEVQEDVDLAVIVIPANLVFDAVKDCADNHVKFAAIITSGFSELGNTAEEHRIVKYAAEHNMRVVGPNIIGVFSSAASLNATFGPAGMEDGSVALLSQSGALAGAIVGKTIVENIGLSSIVSLGNKADIDETDLLPYLADSDQAKVIMMYMEGVTNGEKLVAELKKITRRKPVVVLKSGRSRRGALAAASHTGSLAGEDKVFDDIARQCGLIRAGSIQEALQWCKFIAGVPEPKGENTVIITNGGGLGVLTADACEKYGVNLYDNLTELKSTFSTLVPEFGSIKNPIDLTGQAKVEDYSRAIEAALSNDNIHAILCLGCESGVFDAEAFAKYAGEQFKQGKYNKPLFFSFVGGPLIEKSVTTLQTIGVPIFNEVDLATACLGAVYYNYRQKNTVFGAIDDVSIDEQSIRQVLEGARKDGRRFLLAQEGQAILRAIDIPGPASGIAHNLDEAVAHAEKIGYPVVMKIVSRDILHKSDAGGVALDIDDRKEAADAYEAILQNCRRYKPDASIDGIEVSEQIRPGIETIVGARRDLSFGPIVMFGLGGIYVEVMKDIAFRAFPLGLDEAVKMIGTIKTYPLLLGVRGEQRKDIDALALAILKVGAMLKKFEEITDIEINPLVAYDHGEGVKAVDVRILLTNQEAKR